MVFSPQYTWENDPKFASAYVYQRGWLKPPTNGLVIASQVRCLEEDGIRLKDGVKLLGPIRPVRRLMWTDLQIGCFFCFQK